MEVFPGQEAKGRKECVAATNVLESSKAVGHVVRCRESATVIDEIDGQKALHNAVPPRCGTLWSRSSKNGMSKVVKRNDDWRGAIGRE